MKRYRGAIFDMDGILFDTERIFQQTWREIAAEMGLTLGDDFTRAICGTSGDTTRQVVERFFHVEDGTEIMLEVPARVRDRLSKSVPVKPGVPEILQYFRAAGLRVAVASSSARAQIESNLRLTGLGEYFDAIVSGEDVSHGKPDPEIFLLAADAIECDPALCFVFEDSQNGVVAGRAAGCDTVMVPDQVQPAPEIAALCFRICDDMGAALRDIREIMEQAPQ